jgi:transposase
MEAGVKKKTLKTVAIDGRSLDRKLKEHMRVLAVRRVREGGEKPSEVMSSLGLCRTSVYRWLRASDKGGDEALAARPSPGRDPLLEEKHKRQILRWVVGKDPRQYGLDFGLWTRAIIRDLLKAKFEIEASLNTVGRALISLNLTPQKPLRRAYERDAQTVEKWKSQEYPRLKRKAKRRKADIFFEDEAGFSSEPNLGRTYGLRGETPIVRTSGQRQKVSAISAVNAKGAFWSDVYTGALNAERFVGFLKAFMRGRRRNVFLVLDGHPSHRAKSVADYVKAQKGRLELHFLPPYAPDLNPDEFVWHYAKSQGVSKKPLKKNEALKDRVAQDLSAIKKNKRLASSFFHSKSVAYTLD